MPNAARKTQAKKLQTESKKHQLVREAWKQYVAHCDTGVRMSKDFRRAMLNLVVDAFYPNGIED